MAREEDLWDDSALIHAFNEAISKYKKVHKKGNDKNSAEEGNEVGRTEENISVVHDQEDGAIRGTKKNLHADLSAETTTTEIKNLPNATESNIDSSTDVPVLENQYTKNGSSDSQVATEYTQLLARYYELEDKRQKVWQQLQQFGDWNSQYASEASTLSAHGATYLNLGISNSRKSGLLSEHMPFLWPICLPIFGCSLHFLSCLFSRRGFYRHQLHCN